MILGQGIIRPRGILGLGILRGGIIKPDDGDSDALAYIAAVEGAKGSPVTQTQKDAINAFYVAEKTAGRYAVHMRMFLPIWENEDANAIDMITLGSGGFNGGMTHEAGYAEGNGTDGNFIFNGTTDDIGVETNSHTMSALVYRENQSAAYSSVLAGGADGSSIQMLENGSHNIEFYSVSGSAVSITGATGVICCSRTASDEVHIIRRTTSGVTTATADHASSPIGNQVISGWARAAGTSLFGDQRIGMFQLGMGMEMGDCEAFTAASKTLWETCTGLTLP